MERPFRSPLLDTVPGQPVSNVQHFYKTRHSQHNPEDPGWCKDATLAALKAGYRHLDCAWAYGVNEEIGQAIKESGIPRSEIFVTTKFWPHFAAPENVELCLDICLREMGLEYVDLWLAHWPYAAKPVSRAALEKAKGGATRSDEDKGQLIDSDTGKPVIDWEHSAKNIAELSGRLLFVSTSCLSFKCHLHPRDILSVYSE